jgi:hypothetical protein
MERRESSALTNKAKLKNTNVTFRSAKKYIVAEKISLNVSRLFVSDPLHCTFGHLRPIIAP